MWKLGYCANGDGYCVSDNSHSLACASTRLVRNQGALPVSSCLSGRPGAPSRPFLFYFELLVGVLCREAAGGQCLISATVTATRQRSLLVPKDMERSPFSSLLPCFFTQVPKQHDLCPVSAEPPPFLFQPPSLSPHQGCQKAGLKQSLPLSLISA